MNISVQLSLYPLGQSNLSPAIQAVLDVLEARGLRYQVGTMSTLIWGGDRTIFTALQEAFAAAADYGPAVMTIAVSNACPEPRRAD